MRKKVPIISLMGLIKSVFLFWIKWYHRRDDSYQRTWCLSRQHSKVDVILPQLRKRPVDGRHLKSSLPGCNPKQMNHTQQVPQLLHVRRASRSSNVYQKKWAALPALSRAWLKSVCVLSKVCVFLDDLVVFSETLKEQKAPGGATSSRRPASESVPREVSVLQTREF